MENEKMQRYPNLDVNKIKALFPRNTVSESSKKSAGKVDRKKKKKFTKAQQQREALFGGSSDIDADPVSEKSDCDAATAADLSATDVEEAVDILDEEDSGPGYPQPCDVISWKKLTKDSVLVGLPYDVPIFFKGCLQVRVVRGCLEVFGHRLRASEDAAARLYSPRGSSLLALQAVSLLGIEGTEMAHGDEGVNGDCLFVAKRLAESWTDYVQAHVKQRWKLSLFGRDQDREVVGPGVVEEEATAEVKLREMEKILDITVINPSRSGARLCEAGQEWEVAVTSMRLVAGRQPRLLAAGGKGVGKSTFLRWMANRLLATASRVLYVDLDPGQREFGLPGYISITLLDSPILGPNFCDGARGPVHRSIFLGDISVGNCPGRYLSAVSELVSWAGELDPGVPWLVNTMGWCKGLGLLLIKDVIQICVPTTVVQLYSRFHRKNFPVSLSPEYVSSKGNSWKKEIKTLSFSLLEFLAVPERHNAKDMRSKDSWGMPDPRTARELVLLSWLGRAGGLAAMPIYSVPFNKVALHVCHIRNVPAHGLLAALNLTMVDLCHTDTDKLRYPADEELYATLDCHPLAESLGTGFVRGIDPAARLLYIATTLPIDRLETVNCLLGGAVSLPESVHLESLAAGRQAHRRNNAIAAADQLPYVASGPTDPLDLPWQRSHQYGKHSFG